MMRPARQDGSEHGSNSLRLPAHAVVLLLTVLSVGAMPVQAQSTATPAPTAPAGLPPLPKLPAGTTPSAAQTESPPTAIVAPALPRMPASQGAEIDRVVAIVNGELILDSDVNQERRFAALLPYGEAGDVYNRDQDVERLINRDLILQQAQLQPEENIALAAAEKNLDALRRSIPACQQYHCETQAGWDRFLATEGFTEQSLAKLWQQRMEVMAFIQQRFQMGIRISPQEVQTYYEETMLPEYAARHVKPPPVEAISSRIEEVLLQQQVSKLLDDWLRSLRAQGSVVVLHPGEEAP